MRSGAFGEARRRLAASILASVRPCATILASVLLCATILASVLLRVCSAAGAGAQTPARLSARFDPERLGKRTTLDFGFAFSTPAGQVPPPLTQIELRYPTNLGIALSGLGLATCVVSTLEGAGPSACPPNSVMGYGVAFTAVTLGTTIIGESTPITIFRTPDKEGRLAILFYAEGSTPVDTHIVFPGLLLPASSPFGGLVSIGVPLVPTLPDAPYISVVRLRATIGPRGVTYYERLNGATLAYRPLGILLPSRCPRAGFPFAAHFSFADESSAIAHTAIPCPSRRARHRAGRG